MGLVGKSMRTKALLKSAESRRLPDQEGESTHTLSTRSFVLESKPSRRTPPASR